MLRAVSTAARPVLRPLVAACKAGAGVVALAAFAATVAAADVAADGLVEIQLTPAGAFRPSDGRELPVDAWRIDGAIAARVIERFNARANDAVLDYEHQTLLATENGLPAPAAGWIKSLSWREGSGLWGQVQLTAKAREYIAGGEYRYISPVIAYDPETGEVVALLMAAITNNPAIDGMQQMELRAAATFGFNTPSPEEAPMNKLLAALCALLALDPKNTTEDQAVAALGGLAPKLDALAKLRAELGVAEDADASAAVAACSALKTKAAAAAPDPAQYVPVGVVESLKADLAALKGQHLEREVTELVDQGIADGRLLVAQRDWATSLGKSDIAALRSYLETAAPIAALRGTQTQGNPPAGGQDEHGLTQAEIAVCRATGVDPKDFAAAKKAQA